jgi:hypothetical protein
VSPPLALLVRVERTEVEFERLRESVTTWLEDAALDDPRDQHKTQRLAVEADLSGALDELKNSIGRIDLAQPLTSNEVYDTCRVIDQSLVVLRQLWEFYRDKLDQRRDALRLGPLLHAADELIWSCHRRAMERASLAEPEHKKRPAPLAYVASDYSPAAFESDKPLHAELGFKTAVPALQPFLDNPAIPVLRLPPWCVDDPWWLAFIAHEVGHHVLHDLDLVRYFREGVEQAARMSALPEAAAEQWGSWAQEIFADVYSVLMLGPPALRALVEIEWAKSEAMNRPRGAYPPALVRLELMARFADKLGMDLVPALPFGRPIETPAVAEHWKAIDAVVEFALGPMRGGLGTLCKLAGLDADNAIAGWFGPSGGATQLGKQLRQAPPTPAVARHLDTARQVASGAMSAWSLVVGTLPDKSERDLALERLRVSTCEAMRAGAPLDTRAGQIKPPSRGASLAQRLLDTSRQQLQ